MKLRDDYIDSKNDNKLWKINTELILKMIQAKKVVECMPSVYATPGVSALCHFICDQTYSCSHYIKVVQRHGIFQL